MMYAADIDADEYCCHFITHAWPPSTPTGIDISHCVHPSVRPEIHYHSNSLRISAISIIFGGMMHSNMKPIAI